MFYRHRISGVTTATSVLSSPRGAGTLDTGSFIALFLTATFIIHGVAFTIFAFRRRKTYYFCLTGTFAFLTAIYFIKFGNWILRVPGFGFPVIVLLRIGAALCTTGYLRLIYDEEGSWLWKLTHRRKPRR